MSNTTHWNGGLNGRWPQLRSMTTVAASWSLAGGVAGGVVASGLVLSGRLHPDGALILTVIFAAIGSGLGIVHGAVLGHLGRRRGVGYAWGEITIGGLAAVAALVAANVLSHWLVLGSLLARSGSSTGWAVVALVMPLCLGILAWATLLGWHTFEVAFIRWPEHRLGGWLVAGSFAVIALVFLTLRPAIPGTRLQLSWWATLGLSAMAALWIAVPAIVAGLRLMHQGWNTGPASITDR